MLSRNSIILLIVQLITIALFLTLVETVQGLDGNEGDSCFINSTQQEGICTKKIDCEQPCAATQMTFELCQKTSKGRMPIVCCPKPIKSISGKKCQEYKEYACNRIYVSNGIFDKPIVSKVSACAKETQMAQLRWKDNDRLACGGTLISDLFVLSAALCIRIRPHGRPSHVRLGQHDRHNSDETEYIDVQIDDFILHPDHDTQYFYDDIGLIKLKQPVMFTDAIRPACLPEEPISADTAMYSGWDYRNHRQRDGSDVLMKVDLELFDHTKCSGYIEPRLRTPQGYLEASQLCAGSPDNTCFGDLVVPGSPLQLPHRYHYCTFTIIGVQSISSSCDISRNQSIGVFTRVYPYLSWIESVVWPEEIVNN